MNIWRNSHCYCLHQKPLTWIIYSTHTLYIHLHLEIGFKNIWQQTCVYHLRIITLVEGTQLHVLELVSNDLYSKSILEHQITVKGSGLPVYHLRCIGSVHQREKELFTNQNKKKALNRHWKHELELLRMYGRQLNAIENMNLNCF